MSLEAGKFDPKESTRRIEMGAREVHDVAQAEGSAERGPLYTDEFASLVAEESSREAVGILDDMLSNKSMHGGDDTVVSIHSAKKKQTLLEKIFAEGFDILSEEFKDLYYRKDRVGFPEKPANTVLAKNNRDLTSDEKDQVTAFQRFESLRKAVSVKMGRLFPRAMEAVGGSMEGFSDLHLGYAMALTRQVLKNAGEKVDEDIFNSVLNADGKNITQGLLGAELLPESDTWFFKTFQEIPSGAGKKLTHSGMISSIVGMFFTNGAWKVAQVPRAIQTGNPDFITPNTARNFGSYADMVGGMFALAQAEETFTQRTLRMYQLGSRAGQTEKERKQFGVMRAFYEVAKDFEEARKAASVANT